MRTAHAPQQQEPKFRLSTTLLRLALYTIGRNALHETPSHRDSANASHAYELVPPSQIRLAVNRWTCRFLKGAEIPKKPWIRHLSKSP